MRFSLTDFKLKWLACGLAALMAFSALPGVAFAKDCPSNLSTELHTAGNASFGAEIRFWYYYVNQYDYEDQQRLEDSYVYASARGLAEYQFSENLYGGFEALIRNTEYDDDDFECEDCADGIRVNVRELWLDYAPGSLALHAGRDVLAFGNGMVIDNFFDQATAQFDFGSASVLIGGGVLANDVAREATSCQRGAVYEYYPYWKQILASDWGDYRMGFVETGFSLIPKHHQQLMLLYTDSAIDNEQDSLTADMYLNGNLGAGFKYFTEAALQYYTESQDVYGGASLLVSKNFPFAATQQQIQAGLLLAQRDDAQRFAPIYESLWIGERYRYSLYEGNIFYLKETVNFDKLKPVSVTTQYSRKFSGDASDELDVGLELDVTQKYRFFFIYSALNLASDYEMTHQFQFQTRLVF